MAATRILLALAFICIVQAQRPFYAGLRPIGYPDIPPVDITNRFGETDDAPIEARGDRNLVNRIEQMPIDKQPFWYLNWRYYDALRQRPQTYSQRPNSFIDK